MAGTINTLLTRKNVLKPVNCIAAVYIIAAIIALQNYLSFQSPSLLFGLAAMLFILKSNSYSEKSTRYIGITMLFSLLCFLVPVKTLLFFTICFALVAFREGFYGKTGILMPVIIFLAAPAFQYLANIFSFPVRMELTKLAGLIFNIPGQTAEVQGNVIIHQGIEFSVDPACMGLNMMTTSLLTGVILIVFYQTKFKCRIRNWQVLGYLAVVLALNIVANLFRILLLVHYRILPETISHDIAGIGCLLIYVFLPAIWLAAYIAKRAPARKKNNDYTEPHGQSSYRMILLHLLLLGSIVLLSWRVVNSDTFRKFTIPSQQQVPGYSILAYAPGIVKLENSETLIYLKYIRGFYDTEHHPMICWTGSGYQFDKVEKEQIGNRKIFTATLTRGTDTLYSAWWYGNGKRSTTDQFQWRWDLMKGADHYIVVNVSCSTKHDLINEVQKIFQEQTLAPFFGTTRL